MFCLLNDLKEYNPKKLEKVKSRDETLINAERMYNNRNNIIKDGVFPFKDRFQKKIVRYVWQPDWVKVGIKRFDRKRNKI